MVPVDEVLDSFVVGIGLLGTLVESQKDKEVFGKILEVDVIPLR